MPLPTESERAAATVAEVLARFDQQLLDHIETGAPLPSLSTVMAPILVAAERSAIAAIREINPWLTSRDVNRAVAVMVDPIRAEVAAQIRTARAARRRMPRRPPDDDDTPGTQLAAKVGAGAALLLLLRRRRPRTTQQLRQVMRTARLPTPRPTAAWARMVIRTETAKTRNDNAARLADRLGWVIWVEDARKGPTDEACENVNRRFATPRWLRRHRVEHPNCTRKGTPMPLPPGQFVTLLA